MQNLGCDKGFYKDWNAQCINLPTILRDTNSDDISWSWINERLSI